MKSHAKDDAATKVSGMSIRYPVTICMVLISFLVLGGVALTKIPLVMLPDITAPFLVVVVPYPNATPEQIQEEITRPLEEVLSVIPNVKRITSNSLADQSIIELEFGLGQPIDVLRAEVREKVEQIRVDLPDDVRDIFVQNFNTSDIPIIEGRISSGRDLRGSYDFLDLKIKRPLERIRGVANVQISGVARRRIDIRLRLDDIKRYRVDIGALFDKLDGTNLDVTLGQVEDAGRRFGVVADGSLDSLEELRNFPVNERGLLLSDIADIDLVDPGVPFGRHLNGEFAVALEVLKASDANTVDTVNRVMATIEQLNTDPSLDGIEVLVWHNSGDEITNSLSGLFNAGTIGALLAVGVLFLFLRRLGATLAIGLCIPFSIVAAVGFLFLLGNSLNVISMMGLMLSTGMLVDNAVVVLESIYRQLEKGVPRIEASKIGTRSVLKAVTAATLTSVIIFVPLVFGRETLFTLFLGNAGIAIMITLLCSLFISLTLIPLGLAKFFRLRLKPKSQTAAPSRILERYSSILNWTLRRPWTTVGIIGLVVISSVFPNQSLKDNSIEAQDLEDLTIEYEFSESYHYGKIETDFINPVEEYLFANKERFKLENVYSFYANNQAATRLYFDEASVAPSDVAALRTSISEGLPTIPGADIRLGQQEGAENRNFLSVSFYGEDVPTLQRLVLEAKGRLEKEEEFEEIFTGVDESRQEVQVILDRTLARKYGVSPESVAGILGIVVRSQQLRSYRTEHGEIEMWISLTPGDREDLEDLKAMVIGGGPGGQQIRLAQVADFRMVRTPGSIRREDRRTFANIWANYTGDQTDDGKEIIRKNLDAMTFPQGYSWNFGFRTLDQEDQQADFLFNVLLALFMVYFVMASLFESLTHPFAIMLSLVFAWPGVAWSLYLTGTPMNLMAFLGIMILVGIVVNNGIVLLDHINNLRRAGMDRHQAILEGSRERFRPILMTAVTTVMGLVPLSLGTTGIFGLRYFPMARTVMGGLVVSTVLTLIVLPVCYRLLDDFSHGLRRVWMQSRAPRRQEGLQPAQAES